MADKKEVNMLLLGMVAILAIVGLVLMFTSPAATGKAFQPPPLPPEVQSPAAVIPQMTPAIGTQTGPISNAVLVPALEGSNLPSCPGGRMRTRMQGNLPYEAVPGQFCSWFYCPASGDSTNPAAQPMLACTRAPTR